MHDVLVGVLGGVLHLLAYAAVWLRWEQEAMMRIVSDRTRALAALLEWPTMPVLSVVWGPQADTWGHWCWVLNSGLWALAFMTLSWGMRRVFGGGTAVQPNDGRM
jgi:hypothetical protein